MARLRLLDSVPRLQPFHREVALGLRELRARLLCPRALAISHVVLPRDLEHPLELLRDVLVHGVVEAVEEPRAERLAIEREVLVAFDDAGLGGRAGLVVLVVRHRSPQAALHSPQPRCPHEFRRSESERVRESSKSMMEMSRIASIAAASHSQNRPTR